MRKIFLAVVVLLLAFACRLEAAPRIISLAPNTTEILFSLGLGDSVIGLDDFSDYPEQVKNIERLGTFNNPNMERIILLRPDYILVNSGLGKAREDYLNSLGIKIIKISPSTMEGLHSDIRQLGVIFDREQDAENIFRDMQSRIKNISQKRIRPAPKVFVQLFDDPLVTVSSFVSDIIRLAGGENIAQDVKDDSGVFSYEALIDRNPDIILAIGFTDKNNFPGSVNAVKNKRIYRDLDPDLILRPGPRAIEAVEMLNKIFYE
ncbi:MAG: helical backbone metal receptor [Candidatus Omnitrophota bacterium]|nr:helical backbone metal receptor [Candidatus Omnitrophota bacterium]